MASNILDNKDFLDLRSFLLTSSIPVALLILASILIYGQTYSYDYVLDDKIVITDNAYVKKGVGGLIDILTTESFQGYFGEQKDLVQGARYRPLSIMSFALEYQFFGNNPVMGHLINLLLYIFLCILSYRFFRLIFSRDNGRTWYVQISFWASLLYCVHPIHTEVVANVKGRDEILCLIFILLALIQGIKYFRFKKLIHLLGLMVLTFLALLSKESAIAIPVLIPMTLYVFYKQPFKESLKLFGIILIPVLIYLMLRYSVVGYLLNDSVITDVMNNPFYGVSIGDKYATVMYTLGYYVKLLVWPYPLTHDYYPYHVPIMTWTSIWVWAATLAHLALLMYGIWAIFKRRIDAYFILFYFSTLFIVSNLLVSVGTFMNERFLFIPSLAFCGWLIWKIRSVLSRYYKPSWSMIGPIVAGLGVFGFMALSFCRVPAWKNTFSLNSSGVAVSTNSARANLFMGTAIFEEYKVEMDRLKKSELLEKSSKYINKAIDILPSYSSAQKMKAGILAERFKTDRDVSKLLVGFADVIMHNPGNSYVHEYLDYLHDLNRYSDDLEQFYFNAGYNKLFLRKNDVKWSEHFLKKGLQLNYDNVLLNYALGYVRTQNGIPEGQGFLNKARQLDPGVDKLFGK